MRHPSIEYVIPGLFGTGLNSQTFLPGAPADRTPHLDALVAYGQCDSREAVPTLSIVCKRLGIDYSLIEHNQAALCWLAEFDVAPPPWCAVAEPVQLGVGRNGLVLRQVSLPDEKATHGLFDCLSSVCTSHDVSLHIGPKYQTLFIASEQTLDVVSPSINEVAGSQFRDTKLAGSDDVVINRLRNDFEMVLHSSLDRRMDEGSGAVNSIWVWGASTQLPPVPQRSDINPTPVHNLQSDNPLYIGLSTYLGVQSIPQGSTCAPSMVIVSDGEAIIRSLDIERWFDWVADVDARLSGVSLAANSARSSRPKVILTDPFGVQFRPARFVWPWQTAQSFIDRVSALAHQREQNSGVEP